MAHQHSQRFKWLSTAILLLILLGSTSAEAQLKLLINKDEVSGRFVLDGAASYATGTGLVSVNLLLGESAAGGDNPLFCFDYSTADQPVALEINSYSSAQDQQLLIPELRLASALQYQLSNSTIAITPADTVACFFRQYDAQAGGLQSEFGLFGQASGGAVTPLNTSEIFHDSFSGIVSLTVEISEPVVNGDGSTSYIITATNNAAFSVSDLALQQSIPFGIDIALDNCTVNGQTPFDTCINANQGDLRYQGFSLAAGESLVLEVTASRNASWAYEPAVQTVPVYVGFVAKTSAGFIFDTAQSVLAPE